jgi:gliding motility-associated-like protein
VKPIKHIALLATLSLLTFGLYAQLPKASFTANSFSGCSPLTVIFTNTSTGSGPITYLWNFGNGNTSTLSSTTVSATYVLPGTYTVTLTATNASGSNVFTRTAYITVFTDPTADFIASPNSGCAPLTTQFTDLSVGTGTSITKWLWDFGDGTSSTSKNPSKTYINPGVYTVTLIATDANGCEGRITKSSYINVTAPHTVSFSTPAPFVACKPPFTKTFTPNVSPALPAGYAYHWDFGDGNTSTQVSPTHTYTTVGIRTVSLRVTSPSGCAVTHTIPDYIIIEDIKADFSMSTTVSCPPAMVSFINTTLPPTGLNYSWSGPPGFSSTSKNPPSHPIYNDGTYTFQLSVMSNAGCSAVISKSISVSVWKKPNASFTANKTNFCKLPAAVNFTNQSSDANTYRWLFEGHGASTAANPSVNFNSFGEFNVRLIATSSNGCKDTLTQVGYIKIRQPSFTIEPTTRFSGCFPLNIKAWVNDESLVPLTSWSWNMGNGQTLTTDTAKTTYLNQGVYNITVTGSNQDGCSAVKTANAYVGEQKNNQPIIYQTICYNNYRAWFSLSPSFISDSLDTVEWYITRNNQAIYSIGGNSAILHDSIVKKLGMRGRYDVYLLISNKGCRKYTFVPNALLIRGPVAKFQIKMDSCLYRRFQFTNESENYTHVKWLFPDNTSDTITGVFSKTFNGPYGAQKFTLVTYDSLSGCTDTATITQFIAEPPKLNFSLSDTIGCAPFTFTVTNQTTFSPPIVFKNFKVEIGDLQQAFALPATFNTSKQGYNRIKLSALDTNNCIYEYIKDSAYYIYQGSATIDINPKEGCVPLQVIAKHSGIYDNPIKEIIYVWGNGDSTKSMADSIAYTFNAAPVNQTTGWPTRVLAIDTNNCRFSSPANFVKPYKPIPQNIISVNKRCGVDSVRFTAMSGPTLGITPFIFRWRLGNGINVNSVNFFRYFTGDTTYTATMIVTDAKGCSDSLNKTYTINTKQPQAKFDANPKKLSCYKPAQIINFTDSSIAGAVGLRSYLWRFGDNTTSLLKNPQKIYSKPGLYPITLEVTDSLNCKNIVTLPNFIVVGGPLGSYSFSPPTGCSPHEVTFNNYSPNAKFFIWDHADGSVDTFSTVSHKYTYTNAGVYYPRLTMVDSSGTCDFGLDATDSIWVYPLPKPDFSLSDTVICKDNYITFNNITPAHYIPIKAWKWKFGLGDSSSAIGPHQILYDTTGRFTVSLTATDTLGCSDIMIKDSIIRVYFDSIAPKVPLLKRATVQDDVSVLMEFTPNLESDWKEYVVLHQFKDGQPNATSVKRNKNDTSFIETGINTLENTYSYKLYALDVCLNKSEFSNKHTTVELKARGISNAIQLNWTPYTGWIAVKNYEIWKNDPDKGNDFYKIATVKGDDLGFTDTNITCYKPYHYKIKSIEDGGSGQVSWSDTSRAQAIFVPSAPATQAIRATVVNNDYVRIEWHKRTYKLPFSYMLFRGIDDAKPIAYQEISAKDTFLNDMDVDVKKHSYTYIVYLLDSCGGYSEASNESTTLLLSIEMKENDMLKYDPKLSWNAYKEWSNGIDYYKIEFLSDSTRSFYEIARNKPNELSTIHNYVNLEQEDYCYKVTAFQLNNNQVYSESNISCVETAPRLHAPNVFTINGDNLNDLYLMGGLFVDKFELRIYNRWGILVFETNNIKEGWDGNFAGKACQSDVYVYKAKAVGRKGQTTEITGNITLLR